MSRGLASFREDQRMAVATRRTSSDNNGIGYWGAVAFLNRKGIKTKKQTLAAAVQMIVDGQEYSNHNRKAHHGKLRQLRRTTLFDSLNAGSKRTVSSFSRR